MERKHKQPGFTKVENEMLEKLATIRVPGESRQVLDVILRKTCGFHKDEDYIALSQFVANTGLKRPNIIRARNRLIEMNIISTRPIAGKRGGTVYRINQDFESWRRSERGGVVIKNDNKLLSEMIHTKETNTKETIGAFAQKKPLKRTGLEGESGWVVKAVQVLDSEFFRFKDEVDSDYGGDLTELAKHIIEIARGASYAVFTCGRFYRKFRGMDGLDKPLAYLLVMLSSERDDYDYGDGLIWGPEGSAEGYFRTFFQPHRQDYTRRQFDGLKAS